MRRLFSAIVILCLVWVLIPLREVAAFSISVIETEYTTFVSTQSLGSTTSSSRTTVSATPISDYMFQSTYYGPIDAGARANLFDISVFASDGNRGTAYAEAELRFSPLMDASQRIEIHFAGWDHWIWSNVYVNLLDITSNQELWSYDIIPWVIQNNDPPNIVREIANLWTIDTDFSAAHMYELNMFAQVFPAGDPSTPSTTMQLFGLEPVPIPIPSTLLLLGGGLLGLIGWKRKKSQNKIAAI